MHTAADHLHTVFLVGAHQTRIVVDGVILVDHRAGCAVGAQKLRHKYDTSTSQMCAWRGTRYLLGAGKNASVIALPLRLRPVLASALALEVREVRDDRTLQRREAAFRSELGQSPHLRRTVGPRTTGYLSVSICTLLLPLPALRTLISRSAPFPVMTCTCNKVYETRTWLRQLTRAFFAVETTSSPLTLFWDRVDSAGLSRVVCCDAEPAIGWMQKSSGFRLLINPSPSNYAISN